jgi:hypothetical protein
VKRQWYKPILITVLALFLIAVTWFIYQVKWNPENTKRVNYKISNEEKGLLLNGDIVMRKGYGFVSDKIVQFSKTQFDVSHCGMIRKMGDSIYVMHSVSSSLSEIDGMQMHSLERFLSESEPNTFIAMRYKSSLEIANKLSDKAYQYVLLKKPFDHNFDRSDTTTFYCTEVFEHVFTHVLKTNLWEKHEHNSILGLTAFFDTCCFSPVINHFQKPVK